LPAVNGIFTQRWFEDADNVSSLETVISHTATYYSRLLPFQKV